MWQLSTAVAYSHACCLWLHIPDEDAGERGAGFTCVCVCVCVHVLCVVVVLLVVYAFPLLCTALNCDI
jgi:hypothetical protein